jgi:hypothetical protein
MNMFSKQEREVGEIETALGCYLVMERKRVALDRSEKVGKS